MRLWIQLFNRLVTYLIIEITRYFSCLILMFLELVMVFEQIKFIILRIMLILLKHSTRAIKTLLKSWSYNKYLLASKEKKERDKVGKQRHIIHEKRIIFYMPLFLYFIFNTNILGCTFLNLKGIKLQLWKFNALEKHQNIV